ncbi:MAG: hypothetical protein IPL65_00225 [Lewinellaceae bacterium]|nr:hypothetical protein [Lewinellaceae bacterium]
MFRQRTPLSSLDRLEKEANNDFKLLSDLGPEYFGAEHLVELREAARQRLQLFEKRIRLAMLLAGTGAGWLLLALLSGIFQFRWISLAAYALTGLSISFFWASLCCKNALRQSG